MKTDPPAPEPTPPPPVPPDEAVLQAYVDDRLAPPQRALVSDWLERHPQVEQRLQQYRTYNAALHALYDPVLDEPYDLRLPGHAPATAPAAARGPALAWAAALVLGVALGYGSHAALSARAPSAVLSIARQAALAHAAYVPEVRHPVEVGAAEEAHLAAWLSKRLDAPLKAPFLGDAGYRLLGGRLLPAATQLGDAPVALLLYENAAGQRLSLLVRRAQDSRETAFQFSREGSTGVFYWIDGPFGYALAGTVERVELARVAELVYRQLNP